MFTGAVLVWIYYLPHWARTSDAELKRAAFCTSPAVRTVPANMFSEVVATTVLILAILLIGANKFAEGLNPVAVGALIAVIGFGLGGTTGFAINPARDLGPRMAHALLPIAGKGFRLTGDIAGYRLLRRCSVVCWQLTFSNIFLIPKTYIDSHVKPIYHSP